MLIQDSGSVEIKQVRKFSYTGSAITDSGTCDINIGKRIEKTEDVFQKVKII